MIPIIKLVLTYVIYSDYIRFLLMLSISLTINIHSNNVGLFSTEIYANWVRKAELERWV